MILLWGLLGVGSLFITFWIIGLPHKLEHERLARWRKEHLHVD